MASQTAESDAYEGEPKVVYKFCDLQRNMVNAWKDIFSAYIPDRVQVYTGDIFKQGPAADAIVSPANSFGFMDGGIDMAYSLHFGWQLQERLQKIIRTDYDGEILVGQAVILPTSDSKDWVKKDFSGFNEGKPIKQLISAPTMRAPWDVSDTPNAYLAFRAVILAVQKFNKDPKNEPIRSVLVPGLGTAVGRMPYDRCAFQMLHAFEIFEIGLYQELIHPSHLWIMMSDQVEMVEYGNDAKTARKNKAKRDCESDVLEKGSKTKEEVEKDNVEHNPRSISELRKTLESLVPSEGSRASSDLKTKSSATGTELVEDKDTAEGEAGDEIPTVLDPKEIV